jgi:hypothetical protein
LPSLLQVQDYVNAALYMNQLSDHYQLIGTRVTEAKLIHEQNIARWADRRTCALSHPLKLIFVPQACPTIDVILMICNPCQTCLPSSTLALDLTTQVPTNISLVCGYTQLFSSDVHGNSTSVFFDPSDDHRVIARMPFVNAGGSAYVKFRLKFEVRSAYTGSRPADRDVKR